ncbi:hypothetical protein [Bacillus sp. AFS041924]|uniref:hypothetical protein n=1 Tax=Bacillus sp. AFS041924 TaxID=2033503 RepID=UPI000BFBD23F|nr:hypothetical protein [Bacillus sp. AFS041924]PGS50970.1 hypothetical protein COC46_12505 [Bacillus sp. AFS041924]
MNRKFLAISGVLLMLLSILPAFNIVRELWIDHTLVNRYEIEDALLDVDNEHDHHFVPEFTLNNQTITFKEERTGKIAPRTHWDKTEHVKGGEIVKLHILINHQEVTNPNKIWLSNYDRGLRYFYWVGVAVVKDLKSKTSEIKIVQRLTGDNEEVSNSKWKVITIHQDNRITEEKFSYKHRGKYALDVGVINFTNTNNSFKQLSYHSDILKGDGYPSLIGFIFFPLIYPFGTLLYSIVALIIALFMRRKGNNLQM